MADDKRPRGSADQARLNDAAVAAALIVPPPNVTSLPIVAPLRLDAASLTDHP